MSLTEGQRRALEQVQDVAAAAGDLLTLDAVAEPQTLGGVLSIDVTLSCAGLERRDGGLPLEDRETVVVLIPPSFPFDRPHPLVRHERFAGHPHVQWKHSLCLYQAPATEWNPSDGMFGFLDRLFLWLQQGALGQLDPVGAPLHPPVAYPSAGPVRNVISLTDTPAIDGEPWFGTAQLRAVSDTRVDIIGWSPFLSETTPANVAAAILLPDPFPYEFPSTVGDLITALADRGVSRERLLLTLQWAVTCNGEDAPLYVIIGVPMRGVRGGELRQHLACWYVQPIFAWALKAAIDKYADDEHTRAFGEKVERIFLDWASEAAATWCVVHENRPEIVIRRDHGSPMAWFAGRPAAVWGCGALGAYVAEHLVRAGVKKLVLRDDGLVTPGILVRQPFEDADIGTPKVEALAAHLRRIRPGIDIATSKRSVIDEPLGGGDWTDGADVVIDATASASVLGLLEQQRWTSDRPAVPIVSMAIGHDARRGMVTVALPAHSGGAFDVCRRLKLEACADESLRPFLDEFWPSERRPAFQPEPGCSDATFVGSSVDVAVLAGMMLNHAATDLGGETAGVTAAGHFVAQPHAVPPTDRLAASFRWGPDRVSRDEHAGYQVRIARAAWSATHSCIVKSNDRAGPDVETGGLIFGERDDAARVMWVSEVSGPPPDSTASAEGFVCGVEGTATMNEERSRRSRGSIHYLGMWHTHPDGLPLSSPTDWVAMRRLVAAAGGASRCLMLIIGGPLTSPILGTYVFRAADFANQHRTVVIRPCLIQGFSWHGE